MAVRKGAKKSAPRKKRTTTKVEDKNKFVIVKKSRNNLYGPHETIEAAIKEAKVEIGDYDSTYWDSKSRKNLPNFVTVYKLVPVKRITCQSQFTEEDLGS